MDGKIHAKFILYIVEDECRCVHFEVFGRQIGPNLRFGTALAALARRNAALAPFWRRFGATGAQKWRPGAAMGLPLRLFCARSGRQDASAAAVFLTFRASK